MDLITPIREFNRFYTKRIGVLNGALLQNGFTLAEIRVLWEIAHRDHITAQHIASGLDMDRAFVSRLLRSLKEGGFVRTEVSEIDARIRHLRLTKKGRYAIQVLEKQSSDEVEKMIADVPPRNRARLVDAMHEIRHVLSLQPDEPWNWTLREPRAGDYGWIIHRHGVLYAREYGWDTEAVVAEIVAAFIRGFKPGRERCWIAEREGAIAGCVFLVEKSKATCQLRLLLVEPTARGAGIGKRLVHECILFARSAGYRKMVLWTQSVLRAAHKIYAEAGFSMLKEETHTTFGKPLTGQYWELDLRVSAKSAEPPTRKAR